MILITVHVGITDFSNNLLLFCFRQSSLLDYLSNHFASFPRKKECIIYLRIQVKIPKQSFLGTNSNWDMAYIFLEMNGLTKSEYLTVKSTF